MKWQQTNDAYMREMRKKQKLLHVHKDMYNDDEQSNFFFESQHFVSKIEKIQIILMISVFCCVKARRIFRHIG